MSNPYLTRVSKRAKNSHGGVSEKSTAKEMGAKLHPASGAVRGHKSDASTSTMRLELKSTTAKSMKLELAWLVKISQEAIQQGQTPAVVLSFVMPDGKLAMKKNAQWVCLPMSAYLEMCHEE